MVNAKIQSIPIKYFFYGNDILKLKYKNRIENSNVNSSCEDLIKFAEDLQNNIPEYKENLEFKAGLESAINALIDQKLRPDDNTKIETYENLKTYIILILPKLSPL